MFHVTTFLVGLYVIVRFLIPLPWNKWIKIAIVALIIPVSVHHLLNRIVFGNMFSPEVPREIIIFVSWVFGSMLLLSASQFILDILTSILAIVKRQRVYILLQLRYAIGIICLMLAAFGVYEAVKVPPIKTIEISIEGLPDSFDGYHLVQLTDLHISRLFEEPWAEAVVNKTNSLAPDLIVITGDVIDGIPQDRRSDVAPLKNLKARDGVYVIPGNYEYYFGYDAWMARFRELGINTLENSHAIIQCERNALVLAGITDLSASRHGMPAPNVTEAIRNAPLGAPVILLDHQPKNAINGAVAGADLQLSGHTHGGLILGLDKLIARYNDGFISGLYDVDGMSLYVSNGTALWPGFAIRIGKPPEITSIILPTK